MILDKDKRIEIANNLNDKFGLESKFLELLDYKWMKYNKKDDYLKDDYLKDDYLKETNHFFVKIKNLMDYLDYYGEEVPNHKKVMELILEAMIDLEFFNNSNISIIHYDREVTAIERKYYMAKAKYNQQIKGIEEKLNQKYLLKDTLVIPPHPTRTYKRTLNSLSGQKIEKNILIILLAEALEMENPKLIKSLKVEQLEFIETLERIIKKAIQEGRTTKQDQIEKIRTLKKAKRATLNNEIFLYRGKEIQ